MSGGTQDPYKMVDPNGLQSGATGAAALAFATFAADGANGGTVASLLGLGSHPAQFVTAGMLSLERLGRVDLFSAGLILLGGSIILNIASLVIRWQNSRYDRDYKE